MTSRYGLRDDPWERIQELLLGRQGQAGASARDNRLFADAVLSEYVKNYNQLIPQRALKHIAPVQALKDWYVQRPELFKDVEYNKPGLGS